MTGQLAAFMSYARFDDQHDDGQLTELRERLAAEIRVQTGEEFEIFQDRDIAWGQNWQQRIVEALDAVTLLLVIITPGFFRSPHCRAEAKQFLDRERQLGRNDLILPIYYISTPQIDDPRRYEADPMAATLASRQYADWRDLRFESVASPAARKTIAHLAARMRDTFWYVPVTTSASAAERMPGAQAPSQAPQAAPGRTAARTEQSPHYLDHAEIETERLRQQLTDAEARAARTAREVDEIRQQLAKARKPGLSEASAAPFWDVLDPTEREVLRSVASMRTFAAGATIMEQGEPADYILVILAGRASIRVSENGNERVLAERSRGQLIGERAALQVSIRSASVIALEMIWALVVQTKDFAAFISANPRILEFVQDQRHARGTDKLLTGENCTVILTDVVAFSAHKRTDADRLTIRKALSNIMHAAIGGYSGVRLEDRGDGILIVIPAEVPTAKIMDQLLRVLPSGLDRHNSSHRSSAQFQLRLSVNVGPVVSDEMGVSGEAIIVAARIVEAPAFKEAFTGSTARLGIIVSPFVYDTVVRHDQDEAYVASYFPVPVEVKEYHATAWMMLMD